MIIVFSGYNPRAIIAFLRTLKQNRIEEYAIIAASENDPIFLTQYANKVVYTRKEKQLFLPEIGGAIEAVLKEKDEKKALIIPSTEALNRFLLENKVYFENLNCEIPLVDKPLYEMVSDKDKFWNLCKEEGIKVPASLEIGDDFSVPFVAKPKQYATKEGKIYSPVLVQTDHDFYEFKKNYEEETFTYQEFVDGRSVYLLYYITKNGQVHKFSQENYAQQANGKSMLVASPSLFHHDRISEVYENLFHKIGFYGFVMIELRKRDEDFYMIEANPRLWGPSQLFCDAKYNLFEKFLHEYGYLSKLPIEEINYDAKYMWSGGFEKELTSDIYCVWYNQKKDCVIKNLDEYKRYDMYNREDTREIYKKEGVF